MNFVKSLGVLLVSALAAAAEEPAGPRLDRSVLLTPDASALSDQAPDVFLVRLETSKGAIVVEVHRDWAPRGADRFYNLVRAGYYDDSRFFRVIDGRWAQFGINGDPQVSQAWRTRTIPDDPRVESNVRGTLAFAFAVPNGRTTQVFINLADNSATHDPEPFVPFGRVVEGMDVADALYADYGESSGGGIRGGKQSPLYEEGNGYLDRNFPHLDAIRSAIIMPAIRVLDPPEKDFFSKSLEFHGIPIKAHKDVVDEALYAAYDRLSLELAHLPMVTVNLAAAGAELHIIGRNQVTTDLPEWRRDKGKHLPEYNGLTRDERTRGMGGLLTSCGEENLLKLEQDHYRGRDICLHEFAHNIRNHGVQRELRQKFNDQYRASLDKGHWVGAYAATNPDEFFAELTMWYFGTHGDLHMTGAKPGGGPEGLKAYDPEAFALLDDFYSGRLEVTKLNPRVPRRFEEGDSDDDPDEKPASRGS